MPSVTLHEMGPTPQQVRDVFFQTAQEQMHKAMLKVEGDARRFAPVKTGHLRRSIHYIVHVHGHQIVGEVGTDVRYGEWVDKGTGLYGPHHHVIVPVKARALRFPQPGNKSFTLAGRRRSGKAGEGAAYVIRRSVKGIKPRLFFERAYEQSKVSWTEDLQQVATIAQRKLARLGPGKGVKR